MAAKAPLSPEARTIDVVVRETSGSFRERVALEFVLDFLRNADPRREWGARRSPRVGSEKAISKLLFFFEKGEADDDKVVHFSSVKRPGFPQKRRMHDKRMEDFNERITPYRLELRKLNTERDAISLRLAGLSVSGASAPADLTGRLREIDTILPAKRLELQSLEKERPKPYKPYYAKPRTGSRPRPTIPDIGSLEDILSKEIKARKSLKPDAVYDNMSNLADIFGWPETYKKIVKFLWAAQTVPDFKKFIEKQVGDSEDKLRGLFHVMSVVLGVPRQDISDAFQYDSRLMRTGFINVTDSDKKKDKDSALQIPVLSDMILNMMDQPDITLEKLQQHFRGKPTAVRALDPRSDFRSMAQEIDYLLPFVKQMHLKPDAGCHILFYGLQDSGKTSLAYSLESATGKQIITLGENAIGADGKLKKMTPQERLQQILLGFELFGTSDKVIFLIDDAESVLKYADEESEKGSLNKVLLLRLLKKGHGIWIVNDQDQLHPSVKRRFAHSIGFEVQDPDARIRTLQERVNAAALTVPESEILRIGRQYELPAGAFHTAVEFAKGTNGSAKAIEHSLQATARLVFGGVGNVLTTTPAPEPYYPEISNFREEKMGMDADTFASFIDPHLVQKKTAPILVLSHGPVSSGKKAYWKDEANQKGLPYHEYDFMDLFFDEEGTVDRLIKDTQGGNSVIVWSNLRPAFNPFIASHHPELMREISDKMKRVTDLCPAVHVFTADTREKPPAWLSDLFPLKLKYDYLNADQLKTAWGKMLGEAPDFKEETAPKYLTPGTLATIAWRMRAFKDDPNTIRRQVFGASEEHARDGEPAFSPDTPFRRHLH